MAELASQPTSIQSIYGWHSERKLYVNRRYQRKLVWRLEEKQKLIESLLRKYPIPAILLAERDDDPSHYEIIDGLQRLNAIVSYIEGMFSTQDGRYFDINAFPTAKASMEAGNFTPSSQKNVINSKDVNTFLDYSLAFSIMRKASNEEIDDVFDRINSYGHRLSDQERRQSGIQNEFSDLVRQIACKIRGDTSPLVMPLSKMPEISIDLPMTRHGYDVKADDVFWVEQGILRATDLRDSMDEQCIADISGSIISGAILERSKDTLDDLYTKDSDAATQIISALNVYGADKLSSEFDYCINQISMVCNSGTPDKLRSIIYESRNTNAFPSVFAQIFIAFHECFIKDRKSISSYPGVKSAINNINRRIESSRKATSSDERRKNVNIIKTLIAPHFISNDPSPDIYVNHSSIDIDEYIRRSGMELPFFELKQGILSLDDKRDVNNNLLDRIVMTVCALANNGPDRAGRVVIGVADEEKTARRIEELDGITPRMVGDWHVVGINREARILDISLEDYLRILRDHISKSELSEPLKSSVLSSMDYNAYYGLGVLVIAVPDQREPSYVGDNMYWRDSDNTKLATGAKLIADIGRRF